MSDDDLFGRPEIDALFGLDLRDFVAKRKQVARALREVGERDLARLVDAVAKPSLSLWALNHVARQDAEPLDRALAAIDGQRHAQLGGAGAQPSADGIRQASDEERRAIAALRVALERALVAASHAAGRATIDRAVRTVRGAALDPSARARLEAGCLRKDVEPLGFEALTGMADMSLLAASLHEPRAATARVDAREQAVARAREEVHRVRQTHDSACADVRDADQRVARAEQTLELARRDATTARRRLTEAEERLRAAESELARLAE